MTGITRRLEKIGSVASLFMSYPLCSPSRPSAAQRHRNPAPTKKRRIETASAPQKRTKLSRPWTAEENLEFARLAARGKSKLALAARFKRNIVAIDRRAGILGIKLKPQRQIFNLGELHRQHIGTAGRRP